MADEQRMPLVWVVVPAFNEAKILGATLDSLLEIFRNVVVVDDCSSDRTSEQAAARGAHVCRHPINLGQGAALQTGIDYAIARGATTIVTFDADGQHRPMDARAMVVAHEQSGCDVLLASRFLGSCENISKGRRALLRLATFYTNVTTGMKLTDTHNGLRVLSRAAAEAIDIRQNRMAHASEILEQIASARLTYTEFPVTIIYTDYSKAKGQRMTGAFAILTDLYLRRLYR